ncbi:MAG: hypothetical protein E7J96_06975 [Actinomyces sp.]|nr:hypothetical protein [Actinomyces sp.]
MATDEERFIPLSIREGRREPFKPTTGMPPYLWPSIKLWMNKYFINRDGTFDGAHLLHLIRVLRITPPPDVHGRSLYHTITRSLETAPTEALDVIDALLFLDHNPRELNEILKDVDHEYTVHSDRKRLVKKIDDSVWTEYKLAIETQDEASALLEQAWAKQFSRKQDLKGAWADATKAVEAALKPIVAPKGEASIGSMIQMLKDKPEKWECRLPDRNWKKITITGIDSLANALILVGYEPGRHGGSNDEPPIDSITSSTVVLQAVSIVAWIRQGALRMLD